MRAIFLRYKYYALTLAIALVYLLVKSQSLPGDFKVFLSAADYLGHHQNPYNVWLVWKGQVTDKYAYGPAFAVMLIPLTWLPDPIAFFVFFFVQFLLLLRAFTIISLMLPVDKLDERQKIWWWTLTILCSIRFILHNVEFGQVTILIFYLAIEGIYQIFYGNKLAGSLLLGLAIHIKIMPVVFIPYLLWRKQILPATLCIVFFGLFWLIPLAFGNSTFTHQLFTDWCNTINPLAENLNQHQERTGYQIQGLQGLLSAYLLNSSFENVDFKFNLMIVSQPVFRLILEASRLFFVLFTLYFLNGSFFRPYTKGFKGFWQLSYLFLVVPIIFPQQQKYSLLLMAPFFGYVICWLLANSKNRDRRWNLTAAYLLFIVLLTTFTSDLFVGMRLNYLFQCMRILAMATILAVPLLAWVKPPEDVAEIYAE
jgi:hypothetical protein